MVYDALANSSAAKQTACVQGEPTKRINNKVYSCWHNAKQPKTPKVYITRPIY